MQSTLLNPVSRQKPFPLPALPPWVLNQTAPDALPPVPTLLSTRLQLELLLGEPCVDLRAAAAVILNDLGATIQIFHRAGEELDSAEELPTRLEHCLAALSTDIWMEVVCADAVERVAEDTTALAELTRFWEQARLHACACWSVAEQMEGVNPEDAYLVGLLHEVARLPWLLGWELPLGFAYEMAAGSSHENQNAFATAALATHWRLPASLRNVFSSPWKEILVTAQDLSCGERHVLGYTA